MNENYSIEVGLGKNYKPFAVSERKGLNGSKPTLRKFYTHPLSIGEIEEFQQMMKGVEKGVLTNSKASNFMLEMFNTRKIDNEEVNLKWMKDNLTTEDLIRIVIILSGGALIFPTSAETSEEKSDNPNP